MKGFLVVFFCQITVVPSLLKDPEAFKDKAVVYNDLADSTNRSSGTIIDRYMRKLTKLSKKLTERHLTLWDSNSRLNNTKIIANPRYRSSPQLQDSVSDQNPDLQRKLISFYHRQEAQQQNKGTKTFA